MKEIKLTRGEVTIVDDEDFEELKKYKWCCTYSANKLYAKRAKWLGRAFKPTGLNVYMHREIMKPPEGLQVDHIDGNGLNNTRSNLRISTQQQNLMNASASTRKDKSSKYKGVSFTRTNTNKPWKVLIKKDWKQKSYGSFSTEEEAARKYNEKAKELFGEFAKENVIV